MRDTRFLVALLISLLASGCSDNNTTVGDGPLGDGKSKDANLSEVVKGDTAKSDGLRSDAIKSDGVKVDAKIDSKPGCLGAGANCSVGGDCCSGTCTGNVCTVAACAPTGATCKTALECCNLNCSGGVCGGTACLSDGQACTATGAACCSTQCVSGTCKPLNPACKTAGNACPNGNADCCSKLCVSGTCAAPSQVSYCTQIGDICSQDNQCCTGVCVGATATTAGTCGAITTTCLVDGLACSGCTGCCSSFCAPFSTSGNNICQPASGCHVTGDLCHKDTDCCGGDPTQIGLIPGAGLVKCVPDPKYPQIGTCSDPNPNNCPAGKSCGGNCVPEGDVCHYKDNGGCPSNSIRNDCCDATGNKGQCKLDALGIPRCYGLTTCVPTGGACASSADCCNNLPCVPDASGHLKCGSSCVPQGGVCTTTADCCTGLPCVVPPGSLQGTCGSSVPPPPGDGPKVDGPKVDGPKPGDGPKPDGPKPALDKGPDKPPPPPPCALYGQSCSTTVPCCINQGDCRTPYPTAALCAAGQTNCTCFNPIL